MQPSEIVQTLEAEGVGLELSVRATGELTDATRTLIQEHRDALITLLALRHISGSDYHLNIATSSGKNYVMTKPHHLDEAIGLYPWGVVSDSKNRLITTWGNVPKSAVLSKHDLATGEPQGNEHTLEPVGMG